MIWITDFEHIYSLCMVDIKNLLLLLHLHLHSGGQGVIEFIFNSEILAKFPSREDNKQWPTLLVVQPVVAPYMPFGVGCCLYQRQGNARLPYKVKTIGSHTFLI